VTLVELVPAAPEQESILANLIELYAHDFSEFHALELGPDGRFGYADLPLYWSEPGRHPFLIRVEGKLAGFALVCRRGVVWDVAEFFILRAYRRRGIGSEAAHQLWSRFPGRWEVRVMQSNSAALSFWRGAIATFAGAAIQPAEIEREGARWCVFRFEHAGRDGS
jgi:predicted acetyltransferase